MQSQHALVPCGLERGFGDVDLQSHLRGVIRRARVPRRTRLSDSGRGTCPSSSHPLSVTGKTSVSPGRSSSGDSMSLLFAAPRQRTPPVLHRAFHSIRVAIT